MDSGTPIRRGQRSRTTHYPGDEYPEIGYADSDATGRALPQTVECLVQLSTTSPMRMDLRADEALGFRERPALVGWRLTLPKARRASIATAGTPPPAEWQDAGRHAFRRPCFAARGALERWRLLQQQLNTDSLQASVGQPDLCTHSAPPRTQFCD